MRKIGYCPEWVSIAGSVNAALMMCQLEYWFKAVERPSFYKFLEPCTHDLYKVGDSWREELGMTKSEVRNAFHKIGKMYKSKKSLEEVKREGKDVFEGKYYMAYYDRIRRTTHYFRNTSKIELELKKLKSKEVIEAKSKELEIRELEVEALEIEKLNLGKLKVEDLRENEIKELRRTEVKSGELELEKREDAKVKVEADGEREVSKVKVEADGEREVSKVKVEAGDEKEDLEGEKDMNRREVLELPLYKEDNISTFKERDSILYNKICTLYNDYLGETLGKLKVLTSMHKKHLKNLCNKMNYTLKDFEEVFRGVKRSTFLCGKVVGKEWKASFGWLIQEDNFIKVYKNYYEDFKVEARPYNQRMYTHEWDFEEIERLERKYIEKLLKEG